MFTMPSPAENVIPLKSVFNLRRVDGSGRLFRSARQDRATPDDIQNLSSLGIRTFVDLRSRREYRNTMRGKLKAMDEEVKVVIPELPNPRMKPYPANDSISFTDLNGKSVTFASPHMARRYLISMCPIQSAFQVFRLGSLFKMLLACLLLIVDIILGTNYKYFVRFYSDEVNRFGVAQLYVSALAHRGKQLCFILNTISNPENLPALLSCAQGKDRTGIVTAMVLSILGRSDDYIAEDYALSEEGLEPIQSSLHRKMSLYKLDPSFAFSKKETMLETLTILRDRYGSVENYLESIGFGREDQDKLRQVLS